MAELTETGGSHNSTAPGLGEALLDHIDIPVYAIDDHGRCLRLNAAAERLLGYPQAEAIGKDMHALVHHSHPDGSAYPAITCPFLLARQHDIPVHDIQEVLWTRSGKPLPVECSASPMILANGRTGAVITLKDMRERRAAERHVLTLEREQGEVLRQRDAAARIERELSESETLRLYEAQQILERAATEQLRQQQNLLATVAENAPVGIAVFDGAFRFRWCNSAYQQFLDPSFRQVNLEGVPLMSVLPASDLAKLLPIFQAVAATGETFTAHEFPVDGFERGKTYWRWSMSRLSSGDLMLVAAEITAQVNDRRELETVYRNAPIALALLSATDFCYLRVNQVQAEILGLPAEEIIGRTLDELAPLPGLHQIFDKVAAGASVFNHLLSGVLPGQPGQPRHWLFNLVPNFNESGEVVTISAAATEITAQKRAEDALVQADKLAAVGRLAASISHEINNPLEAVTNLLYLVHQDPALTPDSAEYIRLAESELARVSQIASQTLRFQRHAVKPVVLLPHQLVEPVLALYQGRLKNTRIRLEVQYKGELQPMTIFEGDVRQILNNLIGNAIDAMANTDGVIRIRARAARCSRNRTRGTRISICDTGHGMTLDTASRIFEPFYTTKGAGGSGLGLWISHTLAHRHKGALQVRSRHAKTHPSGKGGTTFSLFLPNLDENTPPSA